MTAESIRGAFHERMSNNTSSTATTAVLIEIAAQLAELNARLASVQMPEGVISVGLCRTNDTIPVQIMGS